MPPWSRLGGWDRALGREEQCPTVNSPCMWGRRGDPRWLGTGSQRRWETALEAPAPVEGRPPPFPSVHACVPAGGLQARVVRCSAGKSGCERRPGSRALPDVIISALKWLPTVGAMGCWGRKTTIADPSTLDHSPPQNRTSWITGWGGGGWLIRKKQRFFVSTSPAYQCSMAPVTCSICYCFARCHWPWYSHRKQCPGKMYQDEP